MTTEGEVDARAFLLARRGGRPLTLGALLRAIRLGEGTTQPAFAAQLGVTKQHLSDIEHDRRGVSIDRAAAWAKTLGYHPGQFVELAIEAQLRTANLPYAVTVSRAVGHAQARFEAVGRLLAEAAALLDSTAATAGATSHRPVRRSPETQLLAALGHLREAVARATARNRARLGTRGGGP